MAPRLLVRQAETIRQRLLHVAGVKKVNILGERPERIFVEFSYPRLVTLGISARDIFTALQGQNTVTPAGSIDASGPQVFVRLDGAYDDLQKIADTPIVAGGRNLKLSDVAEIRRGYEDPATFLIRHQGEPALVLGVVMQEGWNGLDLGKALETETKAIADSLPLGVTLEQGHGSGGQYPPGRRRVHAQVLHGARRRAAGEPDQPRLARRHRRRRRRSAHPRGGLRHHAGHRARCSTASRSARSSWRSACWSTMRSSPSR